MADSEFEEFRQCFDNVTHHVPASAPFYSLVPDNIFDDNLSPTSSKSDDDGKNTTGCESLGSGASSLALIMTGNVGNLHNGYGDDKHYVVDDSMVLRSTRGIIGNINRTVLNVQPQPIVVASPFQQITCIETSSATSSPPPYWTPTGERRRRRLPEIPKSKRVDTLLSSNNSSLSCEGISLASELASASLASSSRVAQTGYGSGALGVDDSSPDSERPYNTTDVDSGHSTAHSPIDGAKSLSPPFSTHHCEMLEATHRGLHKFVPRHRDEIEIEIGDPVYVQKEADDLWCEGVNLRTGRAGIFPSAYAVDTEYSEFDPTCEQARRERYLLGYLGSVETMAHKGTAVVCQATRRVADAPVHACVLEVSDRGLRMVERTKPSPDQPCIDYFYSLKNVSFCAFHPRDHRYLGFITKHPTLQRFACHIFRGNESTRPVAEAVGRAFQRFYQKFIETAYPTEDIYIE